MLSTQDYIDLILGEVYKESLPHPVLIYYSELFGKEGVFIAVHLDDPTLLLDPLPETEFKSYSDGWLGEKNKEDKYFVMLDIGETVNLALNKDPLLISLADNKTIVWKDPEYKTNEFVNCIKKVLTSEFLNVIKEAQLPIEVKQKCKVKYNQLMVPETLRDTNLQGLRDFVLKLRKNLI